MSEKKEIKKVNSMVMLIMLSSVSFVIFLVFLLIIKVPNEDDVENMRKQREAFMKDFAEKNLTMAIVKTDLSGKILPDQATPLKIVVFPKQDCDTMTTSIRATEELVVTGVSSLTHSPCGRALHPISLYLKKGTWGRLHIFVTYKSKSKGEVLKAKSTELYFTPTVKEEEMKKRLDPAQQVGIGYQ